MASNTTPSTATAITSLPFTETTDPGGAPASPLTATCGHDTMSLWWSYRPPNGVTGIGFTIASTSAAIDYQPALSVWTGSLPLALTQLTSCCYLFFDPSHSQIQVTPETTYYFQVTNGNSGLPSSANLTFTVETLTTDAPAGSLLITSDIRNQATVVLSDVDGTALRVLGIATSEQGDWLETGELAVMAENETVATGVEIWASDLSTKIATVTSIIRASQSPVSPIRSDKHGTWYVASVLSAAPAIINTVDVDGVVGGTDWTLPADSAAMTCMGVNQAGTILYYANSTNNQPLYAYDLTNDLALPNFQAAAGANLRYQRDIAVLANGDVLAVQRNNATGATTVKRWNAAGSLQQTYTIGTTTSNPRMGVSGDETYFWVMSFPAADTSAFEKFVMSGGGTPSVTFSVTQIENTGDGPLFGPSGSCPLLVLPVTPTPTITDVDPPIPECAVSETQTFTITGVNFPDDPTVTVLDPNGNPVDFDLISSSPTEIVIEFVVTLCGEYTFQVDDSNEFTINTFQTHLTRRVRRFPLPYADNKFVFISRLEFLFQPGTGYGTGQGQHPVAMIRISGDGGRTWGTEQWLTAGDVGEYGHRMYAYQLGRHRDPWCELVVTDPNDWYFMGCTADVTEGTS